MYCKEKKLIKTLQKSRYISPSNRFIRFFTTKKLTKVNLAFRLPLLNKRFIFQLILEFFIIKPFYNKNFTTDFSNQTMLILYWLAPIISSFYFLFGLSKSFIKKLFVDYSLCHLKLYLEFKLVFREEWDRPEYK